MEKVQFFELQKKRAVAKFLQEYHSDQIYVDPYNVLKEYIPNDMLKEVSQYATSRSGRRYKYCMFSINPKSTTDLNIFIKKVNKCVTKKWIDYAEWCYETREMFEEEYVGIHAHIKVWINADKKPSHMTREVYNTFKDIVGNRKHVFPRYSNVEGCFDEYIRGYKKGVYKDGYFRDEAFRKKEGLKALYTYGHPPTCKDGQE